jgi:hypothetical protein
MYEARVRAEQFAWVQSPITGAYLGGATATSLRFPDGKLPSILIVQGARETRRFYDMTYPDAISVERALREGRRYCDTSENVIHIRV